MSSRRKSKIWMHEPPRSNSWDKNLNQNELKYIYLKKKKKEEIRNLIKHPIGLSFPEPHDKHTWTHAQAINLKNTLTTDTFVLTPVWVLGWKTLRQRSAAALRISLPHSLHSARHHSLTTDQSPQPYVVMSCSLRVKRRRLSCPSAPVCGTFQCFNISMAVRRTIKPNLPPPERKRWS